VNRASVSSGSLSQAQRALHALNRLGFGPRPGDLDEVQRTGIDNWAERQLHPDSIPEPPDLRQRISVLQTLQSTPEELFVRDQLPLRRLAPGEDKKALRQQSQIIVEEAVQGRIIRALEGPRQLQEVMTAFWFNHFNVFAGKGLCHLWIGCFEQAAIRPYTMGRFRELLGATAEHPAMLFYLDKAEYCARFPGCTRQIRGNQ
jgi:uncharacterized protein (DUF1800 family)